MTSKVGPCHVVADESRRERLDRIQGELEIAKENIGRIGGELKSGDGSKVLARDCKS